MRDDHYWPAWDSDPVQQTDQTPAVDSDVETGHAPAPDSDALDEHDSDAEYATDAGQPGELAEGDHGARDAGNDAFVGELLEGDLAEDRPTRGRRFRTGLGKVFMITGGVLGVLVVLYAADLLLSAGDVPRGVTVAGVEVGGMSQNEAESTLREKLEPRLTQPVAIKAGDVDARLDPAESGMGLDWPGTLEQAGHQPLSPITRVLSFFTTREVGVVTKSSPQRLNQAINRLADTQLNHPPTEGSIGFQKIPGKQGAIKAYPIEPRQGQQVTNVEGAADRVTNEWLKNDPIEVPVGSTPVKASSEGVHAALDQVVNPAIAKPVAVHGAGTEAVLKPDNIGGAFQFEALDGGALQVKVDQFKLQQALLPQLAETEQEGEDAQIVFTGDEPTVRPAEQGRTISWEKTLKPYMDVIKKPEGRDLTVVYDTKEPNVTTDEANALGINEVVGEFTTTGFSGNIARNIETVSDKVIGAIVKPGETFSLDTYTGPRTSSQGYVSAPVNEDGSGRDVIGGGVSQFTTTLYNAAYFAGLKDAGHTAHTHYVDRYPPARDASSVAEDGSSLDMKFTNDTDTGIAIQTLTSGSSVTVRLWGTNHYRVESSTGAQTNVEPPPVRSGPADGCTPNPGAPGFSTSDTRTVYDIDSGERVRADTKKVTYEPQPTITC